MLTYIYYALCTVYLVVSAALLFSLWRKRLITFPTSAAHFEKPLGYKSVLLALFIYIGITFLVGFLFNFIDVSVLLPHLNYEQIFALTIPASSLPILILLLLALKLYPKDTQQKIWGQKKLSSFLKGILVAIASMSFIALFVFALSLFFEEPFEEQLFVELLKNLTAVPWLFILVALTACLIVPMVEEILFRGFLQNTLVGKWGVKTGILVTSLIFAAFHYVPSLGPTNLKIVGATFILSVAIGILYVRERSLWACFGLHMWNNAFALLAFLGES